MATTTTATTTSTTTATTTTTTAATAVKSEDQQKFVFKRKFDNSHVGFLSKNNKYNRSMFIMGQSYSIAWIEIVDSLRGK